MENVAVQTQLASSLRGSDLRVPPYPAVAARLQQLARSNAVSLGQVTQLLAADATLAATVLRHATSALYKVSGAVTLESAVARIGLDELIKISLAAGMGAVAYGNGPLARLRRDLWRRSLLAATLCRELAPRRGLPRDEAFLAGLLHDFGAMLVIAALERLQDLPTLSDDEWSHIIDEHHVDAGIQLARGWTLPEQIAEAIAHHHDPEGAQRAHRPLIQLVANVDAAIRVLDRSPVEGTAELADLSGLDHHERLTIIALLSKLYDHMATFEPPRSVDKTPSAVRPDTRPQSWAAKFQIELKGKDPCKGKGTALSPDSFVFECSRPLSPGWLTELSLVCGDDRMTMLANVRLVQPRGGQHVIVAQPFGLGGDDRQTWLRIIARTRPAPEDK